MLKTSTLHQPTAGPDGDCDMAAVSFAVRTLIDIAARRKGIDDTRCRVALLHFETATLLHRSLRRALKPHKLTDLQFAVLVILFSTEPEPISASVLAEHAAVSRAAITEALDKLEALQFATRARDDADRRVMYVRITAAGQETVDAAINDYLRTAEVATRYVGPAAQRAVLVAYLQLLRGLSVNGQPRRSAAARA
ncbi:MAG: MarR family transcriptional regulator [Verrucomicrobia bacterium]|nr:MarR family transcriptional regulator [Verrucomicrobiota bacterium]